MMAVAFALFIMQSTVWTNSFAEIRDPPPPRISELEQFPVRGPCKLKLFLSFGVCKALKAIPLALSEKSKHFVPVPSIWTLKKCVRNRPQVKKIRLWFLPLRTPQRGSVSQLDCLFRCLPWRAGPGELGVITPPTFLRPVCDCFL